MRRQAIFFCLGVVLLGTEAGAGTYTLHDTWGGDWSDAEKQPANTEDDRMCWAAAAANVLDWTGWGAVAGFADSDAAFGYFQDHWTDEGGLMSHAWSWWFTGENPSQRWVGWSHVDVAGGALAGGLDFSAYYHGTGDDSQSMAAIEEYLTAGYGVAIIATTPCRSHAMTVWGYDRGVDGFEGIWVTDSDDSRGSDSPSDVLRHVPVVFREGRWFLRNEGGGVEEYINEVQALERAPTGGAAFGTRGTAPEPTAIALVLLMVPFLLRRRLRG